MSRWLACRLEKEFAQVLLKNQVLEQTNVKFKEVIERFKKSIGQQNPAPPDADHLGRAVAGGSGERTVSMEDFPLRGLFPRGAASARGTAAPLQPKGLQMTHTVPLREGRVAAFCARSGALLISQRVDDEGRYGLTRFDYVAGAMVRGGAGGRHLGKVTDCKVDPRDQRRVLSTGMDKVSA